jgi:hypothetical protein
MGRRNFVYGVRNLTFSLIQLHKLSIGWCQLLLTADCGPSGFLDADENTNTQIVRKYNSALSPQQTSCNTHLGSKSPSLTAGNADTAQTGCEDGSASIIHASCTRSESLHTLLLSSWIQASRSQSEYPPGPAPQGTLH